MVNASDTLPNTHLQLRAWCKQQEKNARRLVALTPGRMLPRREHPTFAMSALGDLLSQAHATHGWMVLHMPDADLHPWFQNLACAHFPRQSVTIGIQGASTPSIVWIFSDNSALLTMPHGKDLRIYPAAMWLRSQEIGWSPSVLVGKKTGGPMLRIAHSSTARRARTDIEHEELLAAHTLTQAFSCKGKGIGHEIQRDVDAMHGIFGAVQGAASWPTRPEHGLGTWPAFLPHPGVSEKDAAQMRELASQSAAWLIGALDTWGERPHGLCMERKGNKLMATYTPPHGPVCAKTMGAHDIHHIFPPALAAPLCAILDSPPGLAYRFAQGRRPVAQDWHPLTVEVQPHTSKHQMMRLFARWGAVPQTAHAAWRKHH